MRGAPNMRPTVRKFSTRTTFYRFTGAASVNADGLEEAANEVAFEALAFFHGPGRPSRPSDDGRTRSGTLHGYANAALRGPEDGGVRGDRVRWDGVLYEITSVTPWIGGPTTAARWVEVDAVEVKR